MKRFILVLAAILLLCHAGGTTAWAQERPPLALQIEFEWTVIGLMAGIAVGALVWLTDPADPNANLTDNVAIGAAWGAIGGAAFGIFILQRSAIFPAPLAQARDPLAPRNRITADPVATQIGDYDGGGLLALGTEAGRRDRRFTLPLLSLRF